MVHLTTSMANLTGQSISENRLILESLLGSGAYGQVYKARDSTTSLEAPDYYAVKQMRKPSRSDHRSRLAQSRELRTHDLCQDHPNVVSYHGSFYEYIEEFEEEYLFVVLDFADAGDLFGLITSKLEVFKGNGDLIKDAFVQVLDAVSYCHSKGVAHRDLKPENILASLDGHFFISDFGLATTDAASKEFGAGSYQYMAPEAHVRDPLRALPFGIYSTRQADVFSLGVILINIVTSRSPWQKTKPSDANFKAFIECPDYLLSALPISRELHTLLLRAMDLNPLSRITIPDFRRAILAIDNFWEDVATPKVVAKAQHTALTFEDTVLAASSEPSVFSSISSTEIYGRHPLPRESMVDLVNIPIELVDRSVDESSFVIGSSSSSDSEGPITPPTDPTLLDDDLEVATLEALDSPTPVVAPKPTLVSTFIDFSPNTASKLIAQGNWEAAGVAKPPLPGTTVKAGVWRSAVRRLREVL